VPPCQSKDSARTKILQSEKNAAWHAGDQCPAAAISRPRADSGGFHSDTAIAPCWTPLSRAFSPRPVLARFERPARPRPVGTESEQLSTAPRCDPGVTVRNISGFNRLQSRNRHVWRLERPYSKVKKCPDLGAGGPWGRDRGLLFGEERRHHSTFGSQTVPWVADKVGPFFLYTLRLQLSFPLNCK
jgi:hypothetical protein